MVSQDSPSNPESSLLHQCIISSSRANQNQFENPNYNATAFPRSFHVLPSIQSLGERMSRSMDLVQDSSVGHEPDMSHTRHLTNLLGAGNETQGLSLSLGSHVLVPEVVEQQYRRRSFTSDVTNAGYLIPDQQVNNIDYSFSGGAFASPATVMSRYSSSSSRGTESFIGNSRYLKPAQFLLQEIVNVCGKTVEINNEKYVGMLLRSARRGGQGLSSELKAELCSSGILQADKHERHVKIAKLLSLLEELERRYEQYYNQMEQVVASFEEIVGSGSAKSYTGLALQAMSRHFCTLRDAIFLQINDTKSKCMQDLPKISKGMSQLSLFDKQNRIPLQQLGMIPSQRQVWRPIRGLPETSVMILRSWLFEHFLHPYPNDSEKLMLSSQTGLSKNQVSNWFINARVRLWKPMIEEMYKEEFADSSDDSSTFLGTREGGADHSED